MLSLLAISPEILQLLKVAPPCLKEYSPVKDKLMSYFSLPTLGLQLCFVFVFSFTFVFVFVPSPPSPGP